MGVVPAVACDTPTAALANGTVAGLADTVLEAKKGVKEAALLIPPMPPTDDMLR